MKGTFAYYIDAILYAAILFVTIVLLKYYRVNFNMSYLLMGTLIVFVAGKKIFKRFIGEEAEENEEID